MISLLSDIEVQSALNKRGRLTSLSDKGLQSEFGVGLRSFAGKNKAAIFKRGYALQPAPTVYENNGRAAVIQAATEVTKQASDTNTALKKAEQSINQYIEANKKQ